MASKTLCPVCDKPLHTCDTVWAAEGTLYCSRECGIADYTATKLDTLKDDATVVFDEVCEEIDTESIGIKSEADDMEVDYQKNEWCVIYVDEMGERQYMYFDLFEQANQFLCSIRGYTCIIGMVTTCFKNIVIEGGLNNGN